MFLLSAQWVCAQTIEIEGSVVDKDTREPVPGVHIYDKQHGKGTVTDQTGKFQITVVKADTLTFSAIGFERYKFYFTDQKITTGRFELRIEMDTKTYELAPVSVRAYRTLDEFKKDILALKDAPPAKEEAFSLDIKGYQLPPEEGATLQQPQAPAVRLNGPVTALYNALSKEGKQQRKLTNHQEQQMRQTTIANRYNLAVVKRITGLNDKQAELFMEWCKLEDNFIIESTEYELVVAMLTCLDEFNAEPPIIKEK